MDIHIQRINPKSTVSQVNKLDRVDPQHAQETISSWRYLTATNTHEVVWILKWSYFQSHIPYCENLQVLWAWQSQWIWKKLMRFFHEMMQQEWYTYTLISTNPSNSIINWYKKLWYEEIGSIDLRKVLKRENDIEVFLVRKL